MVSRELWTSYSGLGARCWKVSEHMSPTWWSSGSASGVGSAKV